MTKPTKMDRTFAASTLLPAHMIRGINNYIDNGIRPGSFLSLVLSGDFFYAYRRADDMNRAALTEWISYLVGFCPEDSYGSPELFEAWIAKGGTDGGKN